MVVLDTCAIIESCKNSPGFSRKTLKQIEAEACILSISFAEIACKVKSGKLEMNVAPRELFSEIKQISNMKIIEIGVKEWLDAVELEWPENKDSTDRVVTAFALRRQLSIITSDKKIKAFYKNVMW